MASWQTRAVCAFLRLTRKRRFATEERGLRLLAEGGSPAAAPPARLTPRLGEREVGGFRVTTVRPPADVTVEPGVLLYLHGGAFVSGIAPQPWMLVDHLARTTGRAVHVPHYGLAPAHDAEQAMAFLRAVMTELLPLGPVHLLGDSAGGNLALLLAQEHSAPDIATHPVAGLTVIAPWLDLAISNPAIDLVEPHDPWLSRPALRPIAESWAGVHALTDPAVSPLFGPVDRLPPTAVLVGTRDICLPDCRLLAERAAAVVLHEEPGSPHVHPLLPTPEGRRARGVVTAHVRETLRAAGAPPARQA